MVAIINCSKCGEPVSTAMTYCIKCSYPNASYVRPDDSMSKLTKAFFTGLIIVAAIIMVLVGLGQFMAEVSKFPR